MIGCEVADDLIRSGHKVWLTDNADRMLSTFLPQENSKYIHDKYHEAGVKLMLGEQITTIDKQDNTINVTFDSGKHINCDLIISSIGLKPNTGFAERAKLSVSRGIKVDKHMKTSDDDIYAIGDCAEYDGKVYSFVEPILQQAIITADSICGKNDSFFETTNPTIKMKSRTCPASIRIPTAITNINDYRIETKVDDERGCLLEYFLGNKLVGYSACGEISKSYDYQNSHPS